MCDFLLDNLILVCLAIDEWRSVSVNPDMFSDVQIKVKMHNLSNYIFARLDLIFMEHLVGSPMRHDSSAVTRQYDMFLF